jgi:phosphoserine phosphatase
VQIFKDETIDEFARFLGKDIQQITKKTMDGYLSFRDSFKNRLAAINPTKVEYEQFVESFDPKFTPKVGLHKGGQLKKKTLLKQAIELIGQLRRCGVPSYLVTGGFREIVYEKIAPKLLIPRERIFANVLHFDADGNYAGFDRSQLTSQSGPSPLGKAGVCALLKKR